MDHALQFDMLHPIVAIKLTYLHSLQVSCNLTDKFSDWRKITIFGYKIWLVEQILSFISFTNKFTQIKSC